MSANDAAVALSLQQQLAQLWADAQLRVYAVILGSRVPGLRARLAEADVEDWDQLWMGELDAEQRERAPHLVQLRRESPFTAWLLHEAAGAHGDWGLLVRSKAAFLPLRSHGRALCEARLPGGEAIRLDWADPEVLACVLPLAAAPQMQRVFAPLDSLIVPAAAAWTRYSLALGRLQVHASAVMTA